MNLKFDVQPDEALVNSILEKYSAYKLVTYGKAEEHPLGVFLWEEGEQRQLIGGTYGYTSGSWLYIDYLWLHEKLRGQRLGVQLMQSMEQAAAAKGVQRAFLGTTTFQAPDFYQQLGYKIVAKFPLPGGIEQFLLAREPLTPYALPPATRSFTIEESPAESDIAELSRCLADYNRSKVGERDQSLAGVVQLTDENDNLIAGVVAWKWGDVGLMGPVWVEEAWRDQGHEVEMLRHLEKQLVDQGCTSIAGRTNDARVIPFFEAAGYQIAATIPDFPDGQTTYIPLKPSL